MNTRGLTKDTMVLQLKQLATIDPEASDVVNLERLKRFNLVANDKDLAAKYDITEMVRYGILERIKTKVLIKESGDVIGEDLREAVVWLFDKANSKIVNILYARMDEMGKDRTIKHSSPHLAVNEFKAPVAAALDEVKE